MIRKIKNEINMLLLNPLLIRNHRKWFKINTTVEATNRLIYLIITCKDCTLRKIKILLVNKMKNKNKKNKNMKKRLTNKTSLMNWRSKSNNLTLVIIEPFLV